MAGAVAELADEEVDDYYYFDEIAELMSPTDWSYANAVEDAHDWKFRRAVAMSNLILKQRSEQFDSVVQQLIEHKFVAAS